MALDSVKANAVKAQAGVKSYRESGFFTRQLIMELQALDPVTATRRARLVAKALVDKAITGDVLAIRELMDRVQGKVKAEVSLEHSGTVNIETAASEALASFLEGVIQPKATVIDRPTQALDPSPSVMGLLVDETS